MLEAPLPAWRGVRPGIVLGIALLCVLAPSAALASEAGAEGVRRDLFIELRIATDEPGSPSLPHGDLASGSAASEPPLVVGYRSGRFRVGLGLAFVANVYLAPTGWQYQTDPVVVPTLDYTFHVFAGGRGALYGEVAYGLDFAWGQGAGHLGAGAGLRLMPGVAAGVEGGFAELDANVDGVPVRVFGVFGAVTLTISIPVGRSR